MDRTIFYMGCWSNFMLERCYVVLIPSRCVMLVFFLTPPLKKKLIPPKIDTGFQWPQGCFEKLPNELPSCLDKQFYKQWCLCLNNTHRMYKSLPLITKQRALKKCCSYGFKLRCCYTGKPSWGEQSNKKELYCNASVIIKPYFIFKSLNHYSNLICTWILRFNNTIRLLRNVNMHVETFEYRRDMQALYYRQHFL